MTKRICVAALLAVLVMARPVALGAAGQPPTPVTLKLGASAETEHKVRVAVIGKKRLGDLISATATIDPDPRNVARVTPRIRARVGRLIADPGQRVRPGQPLAILSSAELGQAKTEYLKARSLSEIARQHLAREESLYQRKVASMKDVLEARAANDTALAQYQAAREILSLLIPHAEIARVNWSAAGHSLSDFALTSPVAGTLVKRDLIVGQIVNGDAEVITVMNLDHVWVLANVFEHDLAGLRWARAPGLRSKHGPIRASKAWFPTFPIRSTRPPVQSRRESTFPIPAIASSPACSRTPRSRPAGGAARGAGRTGLRHLRHQRRKGGLCPNRAARLHLRPVVVGAAEQRRRRNPLRPSGRRARSLRMAGWCSRRCWSTRWRRLNMAERIFEAALENRLITIMLVLVLIGFGVRAMTDAADRRGPRRHPQRRADCDQRARPRHRRRWKSSSLFRSRSAMRGMPGITEIRSHLALSGCRRCGSTFRGKYDIYFARRLVMERLPAARELIPNGLRVAGDDAGVDRARRDLPVRGRWIPSVR